MPIRKEPKEQVIYAASKSKVPAFKPLKPSTLPRNPSTSSQTTTKPKPKPKPAAKKPPPPPAAKRKRPATIPDDEDDKTDSDNDLPNSGFTSASKAPTSIPAKRKAPTLAPSLESLVSDKNDEPPDDNPAPGADANADADTGPPIPSQSDEIPSIPQALLLRLLHESFQNKDTKIDKHALQVYQKYMEVFVREAIARCALDKKDAAERGEVSQADAGWLELEDLEKAAPGLMLDF